MDLFVYESRIIAIVQAAREHTFVLVEPGYESFTPLNEIAKLYPNYVNFHDNFKGSEIEKLPTVHINSNGALLATDIYLPNTERPHPVIFIRTPYNKAVKALENMHFVHYGYALVVQDVRGKFESSGVWQPLHSEIQDAHVSLIYIESQSWCNGSIGMIGASYAGYTQWAAAASGHESLKALVSIVTAGTAFTDIPIRGGMLLSGMLAWANAVNGKYIDAAKLKREDWSEVFNYRPLNDLCKQKLGEDIPFFNEWLQHPTKDAFWQKDDWFDNCTAKSLSALVLSGQFDDNIYGSMQAVDLCQKKELYHECIIGPWGHDINSSRSINSYYMGHNSLLYNLEMRYLQWFDKHLKNNSTIKQKHKAQQASGSIDSYNWTTQKWSIQKDMFTHNQIKLYLKKDALALSMPKPEQLSYTYDPQDPTPSLIDVSENEMNTLADYSQLSKRSDTATFYMQHNIPVDNVDNVYNKDNKENKDNKDNKNILTLRGRPKVRLYVSSDCKDTDFIVRLCILKSNGEMLKLCEAQRRAGISDDFNSKRTLIKDEVLQLDFHLHYIDASINTVLGEKLVLQICSSVKNLSFVNHNTAKHIATDTKYKKAVNTIYMGEQYPSFILV